MRCRLRLLFLPAALILAAMLVGCTAEMQRTLKQIARQEGLNLSGHSERKLSSILMGFREIESEDRPQ